ncbi:hypothetical protein LQT97_09655 [Brucella pseudogrignonensis]|uniref:hypothetical protein n=1 Tax=Brucella pseudogrignonensis TaxID=419475 RepID=UPI001E5474E4|nr:hypothetical protein [Brucella pseudogrignonensis]MCD4511502.1 hypothetical protein [Brucella pseudogrignonensis]
MTSSANYAHDRSVWYKWFDGWSNSSGSHPEQVVVDNRGRAGRTGFKQSNYNEVHLQKAEEALARLTELEENDPYHIGDAVYYRALSLLSFLRHSVELSAPMILPEGEEDVSLTWEDENIKRYLSISLDSVEVMDFNKSDHKSNIVPLGEDEDVDYQKLMALMIGNVRTSSVK